jgi:molybdopterin converting factor small subunit
MYALYKDYYERKFEIPPVPTIAQLREELLKINPSAKDVLTLARFAVNNNFIDEQFILSADDTVAVIPPSSGG